MSQSHQLDAVSMETYECQLFLCSRLEWSLSVLMCDVELIICVKISKWEKTPHTYCDYFITVSLFLSMSPSSFPSVVCSSFVFFIYIASRLALARPNHTTNVALVLCERVLNFRLTRAITFTYTIGSAKCLWTEKHRTFELHKIIIIFCVAKISCENQKWKKNGKQDRMRTMVNILKLRMAIMRNR